MTSPTPAPTTPQTALTSYSVKQPAWTAQPIPGTWINWTALSSDGNVVMACAYHASLQANYGTFCYDRAGTLLWQDDFPQDGYCGVFWVAVSADGAFGASGGWASEQSIPHTQHVYLAAVAEEPKTATAFEGFIRAYQVAPFALLLNYPTQARVNVVALSKDGTWLIAGSGDWGGRDNTLRLFQRQAGGYVLMDQFDAGTASIGTAALSEDGRWIVAGDGNGTVHLFDNQNGSLQARGQWQTPAGGNYIQFVSITPDGTFFAASDAGGHVACFEQACFLSTQQPVWVFNTEQPKNVYGVTISADGRYVAASSNAKDPNDPNASGGTVYLLENVRAPSGASAYVPNVVWRFRTLKPPSPSVTMDHAARYLTVADGYPVEDPGHYYLLDVATGACLWMYTTANMNWPMVISADGSAIFAGSDDSSVYFFDTALPGA